MTRTQSNTLTFGLFLLLFVAVGTGAQETVESQAQKELDEVLEMMRQSGMSPEDVKQMEGLMGGFAEAEAQRKHDQLTQEQKKFGATTSGFGTAVVEVGTLRYELTMATCEITDRRNGIFRIEARQAPGMAQGELNLYSNGPDLKQKSFSFHVESPRRENYNAQNVRFDFDGKTATWSGSANASTGQTTGKKQISLTASCGDEAVYFDRPSRPKPNLAANSLTLYLDDEAHQFDIGYCSDQDEVDGNVKVGFGITATGTFRGRPGIVTLVKAEVPHINESFLGLELQLGELTPAQRQLSPNELRRSLQAGSDVMKPVRFPSASIERGMITIDGQDLHFRGPSLATGDSNRVPEFEDLSAIPEVFATCSG